MMRATIAIAGMLSSIVGCGGGMDDTLDAGGDLPDTGSPIDGGPPGELEPSTDLGDEGQEIWTFVQSHLHTTGYHACADAPLDPGTGAEAACYSSAGISAFLQEALARRASDMIITDHNNIDAWFDPAFAPLADFERTRYATPLRGSEWSSRDGHMTLLFPTEAVGSNAEAVENEWVYAPGNQAAVAGFDDYRRVIDSVHAVGGAVMINHPELSIHAFPEDTLGADGVEVGIPPNPLDDRHGGSVSGHSSAEARRYWQRRLTSGDRIAGTAGADHHHGGGDIPGLEAPAFGIAVNFVRIDPALPDAGDVAQALAAPAEAIDRRSAIVIDAVRRGHVMVVESETSARLFVGADTDGDGRFHDAREGDCILPDAFAGSEIRVRLRLTQPSPATGSDHYILERWDHGDSADETLSVEVDYDTGFAPDPAYEIDPDDPFAIEMTLRFDPADRRFVRFVLVRDVVGPLNDTEVVTNPIYYGDWGAECAGSRPLY